MNIYLYLFVNINLNHELQCRNPVAFMAFHLFWAVFFLVSHLSCIHPAVRYFRVVLFPRFSTSKGRLAKPSKKSESFFFSCASPRPPRLNGVPGAAARQHVGPAPTAALLDACAILLRHPAQAGLEGKADPTSRAGVGAEEQNASGPKPWKTKILVTCPYFTIIFCRNF